MLFARWKPDDIPRVDGFDRAAFTLHTPAARRYDERLPQRMRVPCCSCARLEGDDGAADTRWFTPLER